MPKYITIGYGDESGYQRTPENIRKAAHAQDELLKKSGALIGIAGTAVQVRNHAAETLVTETGPYLSSQLPVAGFAVIEAANIEEAIEMVSQVPCAVAYGVVEVWPLESADSL